MIRVDYILGGPVYWRCTDDGRIQFSTDCKRWRIPGNWRGKRVNMAVETVTGVEEKIAKKLDDPDLNYGAAIIQ